MSIRNLDQLFDPASVAVFGASQRAGSVGAMVWGNLRGGGFKGPTYAVNLKRYEFDGQAVFARAADLPSVPPAPWPAPTWCTTRPSSAPACCVWTRCSSCSWPPRTA